MSLQLSMPLLHGEDSEEQARHYEDASTSCPSPLASMFMVVPFKVDHSGGKVHRGDTGWWVEVHLDGVCHRVSKYRFAMVSNSMVSLWLRLRKKELGFWTFNHQNVDHKFRYCVWKNHFYHMGWLLGSTRCPPLLGLSRLLSSLYVFMFNKWNLESKRYTNYTIAHRAAIKVKMLQRFML
jgi:hypothetical protein